MYLIGITGGFNRFFPLCVGCNIEAMSFLVARIRFDVGNRNKEIILPFLNIYMNQFILLISFGNFKVWKIFSNRFKKGGIVIQCTFINLISRKTGVP